MVDSVKNNISHYDMAQQYLKSQINQPKDLADLKRNANIKLRQIGRASCRERV